MMQKGFEFYLPTRVIFGTGARRRLPEQLARLGVHTLLLCTDKMLRSAGVVERVTEILDGCAGLQYTVYDEVTENPGNSVVDGGAALARELGCDGVLGLGGGSALDTATGVAMLMTNGGKALDYFHGKGVSQASLPTILLPTTSGTGSEVNRCFVVTDEETGFKDGVADEHMCPAVTLLDPELCLTMPPKVTASSGIDAFTHALEAYLSRNAHPLSDALNLHAMRLIAKYLRRAYADGQDLEARSGMCLAAAIAGIGFDQVGLILTHAMAHPLSGRFGVPHGVACALLTPPVMEFNAIAAPERLAEVGYILGAAQDPAKTVYEQAMQAAEAFRALMRQLDLPLTLSELGARGLARPAITEADLDTLTADAMLARGMRGRNPRVNSERDIHALYASVL